VDIVVQDDFQLAKDFRALLITAWYFSMWLWIYFKLKNEQLHKSLQ
tara:strand:- start:225 stop:362 length:138 start_codon:yes stop_codon:yes gene_type:complete